MCITGIIMYGTCVFVVSYIFWQYQDIAVEIIYSFRVLLKDLKHCTLFLLEDKM